MTDQNPLLLYGKPIVEYRGHGIFIASDNQTYACDFIAGQLVDGTCLLLCGIFLQRGQSLSSDNVLDIKFKGDTDEGWAIWTEGSISPINNLSNWGTSPVQYTFLLRNLFIQTSDFSNAERAIFKITNFEFSGPNAHKNYIELTLPELNVVKISQVEGYDEIIRRVMTLHGIDISSEIIIDISSSKSPYRYEKQCHELCLLISVARGTKIHWVCYEVQNCLSSMIFRAHYSIITRPYAPLHAIIDPSIFGVDETRRFLECAFTTMANNSYLRENLTVLVNSYISAKKDDYWQLKGLNVVVVLEMLKIFAINNPEMRIEEFIVNQLTFERIEENLKDTLKKSDLCPQQRGKIYQNLKGINRTSFREILSQFCEQIDLQIEPSDFRSLIFSRNKLVHEGRFYTECASREELARWNPFTSTAEEYFFLVNLLDKIFLRLFDYHGPYVNCRNSQNITTKGRI